MLDEAISLRGQIYNLTCKETKHWQALLELVWSLDLAERRNFVWSWPTLTQLMQLKEILQHQQVDCVLSIGCGNALLEWLIKESTGIQMYGLEVDKAWWQSKYAVHSFIPLSFIDDSSVAVEGDEFLQRCCQTQQWNFPLLFCYFNNRKAFLQYLRMYKGHCIVIIGPKPTTGIHTDPSALEPDFPADDHWQLQQKFNFGADDVLAIYVN